MGHVVVITLYADRHIHFINIYIYIYIVWRRSSSITQNNGFVNATFGIYFCYWLLERWNSGAQLICDEDIMCCFRVTRIIIMCWEFVFGSSFLD